MSVKKKQTNNKRRGEKKQLACINLQSGIEDTDTRSLRHFHPSACRYKSDKNYVRTSVWLGLWKSPNKLRMWALSSGRLQLLQRSPCLRANSGSLSTHRCFCRKWGKGRKGGERGLCVASFSVLTNQTLRFLAALIEYKTDFKSNYFISFVINL